MLPKHPLIATATVIAAARHSPPLQPRSFRGFIVVIVVVIIVIVTAVTTIPPPPFCDLFDSCVCSVVVSSPLPHPVVAILPTSSAIIIVVVVVHPCCCLQPPPPRDLFDCCVYCHRIC